MNHTCSNAQKRIRREQYLKKILFVIFLLYINILNIFG